MVLLSILLWLVLIYNLRVAVKGNPLATFLLNTDRQQLEKIENNTQRMQSSADEKSFRIIQRFSRLTLLELGTFLVEMFILIYLMYNDTMFPLCSAILVKNILMIGVSLGYARKIRSSASFMSSFHDLPEGLHIMDRISALISGIGLLYIFLELNNIWTFIPA